MSEEEFGDWWLGDLIGRGAFGEVRVARHRNDPPRGAGEDPEYVGKLVRHGQGRPLGTEAQKRRDELVQREAEILTGLPRHQKIVHFIGIDVNSEYILFVCKYEKHGSLFQALREDIKRALWDEEAAHTFRQLLVAVVFLHRQGVTHRDLKPENILVAKCIQSHGWWLFVKVTDFGLATIGNHVATPTPSRVGTSFYMAPEMQRRDPDQGFGVDYWSLGIILYYLLNLCFPNSSNSDDLPCMQSENELATAINVNVPLALQPVAQGLLTLTPGTRMTAQQALQVVDRSFPIQIDIDGLDANDTGAGRGRFRRNVRARLLEPQNGHVLVDEELAARLQALDAEADRTFRQEELKCDAELARRLQEREEADARLVQEVADEELARRLREEGDARLAQVLTDEELAHGVADGLMGFGMNVLLR